MKADKGAGVVIIEKIKYTDKIYEFINNNEIKKLNKNRNPITAFSIKTRKLIKENEKFIENISNKKYNIRKIIVQNPKTPILVGQIKLHKQGAPIRPVVSSIEAPTQILAQFLNEIITKKLKYKSSYSIKNSYILAEDHRNNTYRFTYLIRRS